MSQFTLPLLLIIAACDPKDAEDCASGFARADDGNCYPITADSGFTESDADTDADADTDTDADTDADADTDTPLPPPYRVIWSNKQVVLEVPEGLRITRWGIAQTDCEKGEECWTGEDCLNGDDSSGELLQYCHPVTGPKTTLTYGGSATSLDDRTETYFRGPQVQDRVTHYAELQDGRCFVTGHDPSYYAKAGCNVF